MDHPIPLSSEACRESRDVPGRSRTRLAKLGDPAYAAMSRDGARYLLSRFGIRPFVESDSEGSGLRFYAPSADARLRAAVLRAHACGVEWSRIDEVLVEERDDVETVADLLDQLEPERHEEATDDPPTSPSLDEKREAWLRLNRGFK
jgi:hypothetical protein